MKLIKIISGFLCITLFLCLISCERVEKLTSNNTAEPTVESVKPTVEVTMPVDESEENNSQEVTDKVLRKKLLKMAYTNLKVQNKAIKYDAVEIYADSFIKNMIKKGGFYRKLKIVRKYYKPITLFTEKQNVYFVQIMVSDNISDTNYFLALYIKGSSLENLKIVDMVYDQ